MINTMPLAPKWGNKNKVMQQNIIFLSVSFFYVMPRKAKFVSHNAEITERPRTSLNGGGSCYPQRHPHEITARKHDIR